jgi:hypothetical protein
MPRFSIGRRAVTVTLSSIVLMAATLVPFVGTVGAAQTSTNCPSGDGTFCTLKISSPSSVQTGVAFTVKVLVTTDGTTVAKSDPCGSTAVVTLDVFQGGDPLYTATAKSGVATFSITLTNGGTWEMVASATSSKAGCGGTNYVSDTKFVDAVTLNAGEPMAPCPPDTNCVQLTSGGGTQATLIAGSGPPPNWTASFVGTLPGGNCAGAPLEGNGILEFLLDGSTTTKTIVLALDSSLVNQGIGQFNVCWQSATPFTPKGGGALVNTGDLPDCKQGTLPCVASKTSGPHNVAFITINADPNDPNDPAVYGH